MSESRFVGWLKRAAILATLALAGALALYAGRVPILVGVGRLLVHEDPLEPADAIVVLGGGNLGRDLAAADLYGEGYAPRIVLTLEPERPLAAEMERRGLPWMKMSDARVEFLGRMGVPVADVTVLNRVVSSTQDEANVVTEWAVANELDRVIVVTDAFHTGRTRLVFGRALAPTGVALSVHATDIGAFDPERWWSDRFTLRDGIFEFQKLMYYRVMYALGRAA